MITYNNNNSNNNNNNNNNNDNNNENNNINKIIIIIVTALFSSRGNRGPKLGFRNLVFFPGMGDEIPCFGYYG